MLPLQRKRTGKEASMRKHARALIFGAAVLIISALAVPHTQAAPPQTLHYQGYLTTGTGAPVNVPTAITFKLYAAASGGSALWSEAHPSVNVANGNYQVILGNTTPFGLPFDAQYWLGVTVGADAEMAPRQALTMVPYAFRAVAADNVAATATIQGSQVTGAIAGATISGGTLAQLQGQFVGALQPTSVAANALTTVDSTSIVGRYASIAIGADGLPVIAHYDAVNGDLRVAKCTNAACTGTSTLNIVDSPGNVGQYPSVAVGTDGRPVIAYYDVGNGDLKVAKCADAACMSTINVDTLDSTGNVGEYTAIAIGAGGLPVISYFNRTNGVLKVARCANADCSGGGSTLNAVDSGGTVGEHTSIAIGADGLPVIAYHDGANFALKVAKCADAVCSAGTSTLSTVDSGGTLGFNNSIAIGADGLPVISYWDNSNGNLKVAKCVNAACTTGTSALSTVDSAGVVGLYTSIAVGADGLPVISYYDLTNTNLKVAKCANAACTAGTSALSTVDSSGEVGLYTSIAIGLDGLPVIAYYDNSFGRLKAAKCANAFCGSYFWRR